MTRSQEKKKSIMKKQHMFRLHTMEKLEDRVVLHGATGSASTAADVFRDQMGNILRAAEVFQDHMSRGQTTNVIANQVRNAFSAFETSLNNAVSDLATTHNQDAFEGDITALTNGLAARLGEILSTSSRAADSLVPFIMNSITGTSPNSLASRLAAQSPDLSNAGSLQTFQSASSGIMSSTLKAILSGVNAFARNPNFNFSGSVQVSPSVNLPRIPIPSSTPRTPRPLRVGPANLMALTFSPSVILLSWDGLTAATGYKLERSPDGTHWTRLALTPAGTTTFDDTGLAPGTTYSYRVHASTPRGPTAYSATITAATVPQTLPDVPESFLHSPSVNGHEDLLLHVHPTVTIFIDGQQVVIPANTNITPRGLYPIHTHDATGTLHVESTVPYTFHLKDFFDLWSFTTNDPIKVFNSQQLLGHPIDAHHLVIVTVNGQPVTNGPDVVLNNDDDSLFSEGGKNFVIFYETLPGS